MGFCPDFTGTTTRVTKGHRSSPSCSRFATSHGPGMHYTSSQYQSILTDHGIRCSMSRIASCRDNAVAESFFSTLKNEQTLYERYKTRSRARAAIFEFIEWFYNPVRQHSHLNGLSPMKFEKANARLTTCPLKAGQLTRRSFPRHFWPANSALTSRVQRQSKVLVSAFPRSAVAVTLRTELDVCGVQLRMEQASLAIASASSRP
jgi:hypothetical protein